MSKAEIEEEYTNIVIELREKHAKKIAALATDWAEKVDQANAEFTLAFKEAQAKRNKATLELK